MRSIILASLLILLSFFQFHFLLAQPPEWVSPIFRKQNFPENRFITGFASQSVQKTDDLETVKRFLLENAKIHLVESISTSIKSVAILNIENRNSKTLEIFKQASASTSQADLFGLKTEEYYDLKKMEAYAFVYMNIANYLEALKSALSSETAQLSKKIETANQLSQTGNKELALKAYYSCFVALRHIEKKVVIILALSNETGGEEVVKLESEIIEGISELQTAKHPTLEELCFFIADGLKQQLSDDEETNTIQIGSFTYMDSRLGSDFAVRLAATLQNKLVREGLSVNASMKPSAGEERSLTLSGTYWVAGNDLKIIANLSNEKTGRTMASMEDFLPLAWLTERNISYIPDNYQSVMALEKELSQEEITDDGLIVKLWTNKGKTNPVYKKDERMSVYVQVNQPCFVRLIYYLADGSRVLLLNSWYIDEDKVNKPYEIPQKWACAPPFGGEILQMVVQTEKFKPLKTRYQDGYDFIIDSDKEIIAITRGMKKVMPTLLMAEKRINITTVEK